MIYKERPFNLRRHRNIPKLRDMRMPGGAVAEVSAAAISSTAAGLRSAFLHTHRFRSLPSPPPHFKRYPEFGTTKLGARVDKSRPRSFTARASSDPSGAPGPISPVEFESPIGMLLAQILQTHPHLLPAAVDQQLENLQTERDAQKEETPPSQDLLYKRIAEVKEKERRKALLEIMYSLIVQKFSDNGISMIPKLSTNSSDPTGRVDFWPNQEEKYESAHSPEAFDMILSHIAIVLGDGVLGPMEAIVQMNKVKLGKLYAASIMYGYFLRRVDERYQLERSMKTLPKDFQENRQKIDDSDSGIRLWDPDSPPRNPSDASNEGDSLADQLRSYVTYLDAETLQRYATIRSKEAILLIEKQTQALFGTPDIMVLEDGSLDAANDEVISLSFAGLTMLVLEAVAFGSFLWDAESYIEPKYHFLDS